MQLENSPRKRKRHYFQRKSKSREVRSKLTCQLFLSIFTPRFLQNTTASLAVQRCGLGRGHVTELIAFRIHWMFKLLVSKKRNWKCNIERIVIKNLNFFARDSFFITIYFNLKLLIILLTIYFLALRNMWLNNIMLYIK